MSEDNNAPNTGEVETTNQSAVSDGNLTNHNNPNDLETPTPMAQSLEMVHEFGAGEMPEEDNEGYAITHAGTGCFILYINIHSFCRYRWYMYHSCKDSCFKINSFSFTCFLPMNFYFIIDIKDEENKASLTPTSQTTPPPKKKPQKPKNPQNNSIILNIY